MGEEKKNSIISRGQKGWRKRLDVKAAGQNELLRLSSPRLLQQIFFRINRIYVRDGNETPKR